MSCRALAAQTHARMGLIWIWLACGLVASIGCVGPIGHGGCGSNACGPNACGPGACGHGGCGSGCSGCGELYIDPWINDPADCCDPCDCCGNHNGQSCGKCRSIFSGAKCLWGYRCGNEGACGDASCDGACDGGCDAGCGAAPNCGCDGLGCGECARGYLELDHGCGCESACDCGVEAACGIEYAASPMPPMAGPGLQMSSEDGYVGGDQIATPRVVESYRPSRERRIFNPRR